MSSPVADDRVLADALASYVLDVSADPDLYEKVRRWGRRRRQLRATGAVAVAGAVAAAVAITAATGGLPQAAPKPAPAASSPAPVYTHANGVRGSLGGDQQLIDSARDALLAATGVASQPKPDSVTALFAERTGKVTVVLFTGTSKGQPESIFGALALRIGTGRWDTSWNTASRDTDPARAAELGQRWGGDPFVLTSGDADGPAFLIIVVPQDVTAEAARGLDVAADGSQRQQVFRPLQLHAGTALLTLPGNGSVAVRLSEHGRVVSHWARNGAAGGGYQVDDSVYPTAEQQHAAAAAARGTVDPKALSAAVRDIGMSAQRFAGTNMRFRVVWGGKIGGESCLLDAMQFDSGALLPELTCLEAGGGTGSVMPGTVPAGAMDRTVIAWSVNPDVQLMAPPGAVRAEIVYANHSVLPVPLDNGYGSGPLRRNGAVAATVRVYGAGGQLLDQRAVDEGVHS